MTTSCRDLSAFLPRRAPMLLLSRLNAFAEEGARATVELQEGNPFLLPDGLLESAAHPELMAYTSPAPSGFIYENGQGAPWETNPANKRSTGNQEARVMTSLVKHILAWIQIDPQVLQQA